MLTPSSIDRTDIRKTRKGTRSCWECKRRKVSCRFTATSNNVCDNCKRRRSRCIDQSYPEQANLLSNPTSPVDQRLKTLENCIEVLSADFRHLNRSENGPSYDNQTSVTPELNVWLPDTEFERINAKILEVWPADSTLQFIVDLPEDGLSLFHGTICGPLTQEIFAELTDLSKTFSLPPQDAHPVLFARPALLLVSYLQSLSLGNIALLRDTGIDHSILKTNLFQAVQRNVTCSERLLNSIEGVECMIVEGMYLNNAGELIDAWHCANRAVLQARLMLLDRFAAEQRPKWLQPETKRRIEPRLMWFRLLQTTGYLSMMLGLRSHSPIADTEISEEMLQHYSPISQMQRMHCIAGAHIVQRCGHQLRDWRTTRDIEKILDAAKMCVPLSWWLIPDFEIHMDFGLHSLLRVTQTMDQLTHSHLIAQLYLPHILFPDDNDEIQHARGQVMDASRDVLLRYVALAGIHSISSFCRIISCLAFVACVSLCFVRTQESGRYENTEGQQGQMDSARDDALIKSALAIMQRLSHVCKDRLAASFERALRQLLDLEPVAVRAERSDSTTNINFGVTFGWAGRLSDDGTALYVRVPGVAVVKFTKTLATNISPGTLSIDHI